ncbi:uncharacterized protein LOC105353998 isoform X3 [Oryzias latipes]|uniref:uncharacterized protein LOC105353998 isoform X3 n=1 Tax=Oryzias latipes TaxID=8090 RepID=UPI0009DA966B|nr:uncharacterized protein LOC105353998 isoform X3 [Oryzias latipes]
MAVWLKQAVLLLLTVAEAAVVGNSNEIILSESGGHGSPREQWNISARSLKFQCGIPIDGNRYRVIFYFKDPNTNITLNCSTMIRGNSNSSTTLPKEEQTGKCQNKTQPNKCCGTTWEIQNLTSANNGFYYCETVVELPKLTKIKSMEVEVFIVPPVNIPSSSLWLWLLVGVSSLIVVILMVLCVIFRRACLREELDPVYANTQPKSKECSPRPAPRPDQLKLDGPYQNLRTPSPSRRYEEGKRRFRP